MTPNLHSRCPRFLRRVKNHGDRSELSCKHVQPEGEEFALDGAEPRGQLLVRRELSAARHFVLRPLSLTS